MGQTWHFLSFSVYHHGIILEGHHKAQGKNRKRKLICHNAFSQYNFGWKLEGHLNLSVIPPLPSFSQFDE